MSPSPFPYFNRHLLLTRFVARRMIDTCPMNTYTLHNVQHGGQNEFLGPRPSKVADGNVTKNPPSGWISACRRRPGPSTFSLCFKFDFLAAGMKCRACRRITGVCVSLSLVGCLCVSSIDVGSSFPFARLSYKESKLTGRERRKQKRKK